MSRLKIDVLANDGSPLGVSEASIHGLDGRMGVGGAELAILTLMKYWSDAGHKVTFYNNPTAYSTSKFKHAPIGSFVQQEDRDILIIFRSPNKKADKAVAKKKVWFSTDQYTVGDFAALSKKVDKIVTISDFHANYFQSQYGITGVETIDLPVRTWEYENRNIEKVKNRMIFCSVPDRGLAVLAQCYDAIQKEVHDVSLTITSDYRLWGAPTALNEQYIRKFMGKSGVSFLGAVSRNQLIDEQLRAEVHPYSCTYEELFCYASAECQVAGCFPISSAVGALPTTNMGLLIHGDPNSNNWKNVFIQVVIETLQNRDKFQQMAMDNQQRAIARFSPERILKEWDEKVLYG